MTLLQLKYISTVAKCGSFSKAAQVLYVSQPGISKMVCALEEELGITIFVRSAAGITLTAEGTEEQVRALLDGIGAITGRSITAEEGGLVTARLKTGREASLHDVSRALFFAFAGAGVPLLEMALKKANLEDIFIELTEQSAEAPAAAEGEEEQA